MEYKVIKARGYYPTDRANCDLLTFQDDSFCWFRGEAFITTDDNKVFLTFQTPYQHKVNLITFTSVYVYGK